jgi:hypothetical protein
MRKGMRSQHRSGAKLTAEYLILHAVLANRIPKGWEELSRPTKNTPTECSKRTQPKSPKTAPREDGGRNAVSQENATFIDATAYN